MTLLNLASRTASRRRLGLTTATTSTSAVFKSYPASASVTARWLYSGPDVKVSHYEHGWKAENVDESVKNIQKYCTQTFNKISEVVSFAVVVVDRNGDTSRQSVGEDAKVSCQELWEQTLILICFFRIFCDPSTGPLGLPKELV
jgi:hypothetical protein